MISLTATATHMRRPEYVEAWRFDGKALMPIWLIKQYRSRVLPDEKFGHWAVAIDGEFSRWYEASEFQQQFVAAEPA